MAKNISEDKIKWILSVESTEAQQKIYALTKENKELTKANKARREELIKLEKQGKKESQDYTNLSAIMDQATEKIKLNTSEINKHEKAMGLESLTMAQLKNRARDLQIQLNNTSGATHPKQYNALRTELTAVNARMKELQITSVQVKQGLGGIDSMFEKIGFAVKAFIAYQLFAKVKELVIGSAEMAEAANGVIHEYEKLDNPGLLDNLRNATKGTINDLSLMKAVLKAKDYKVPLDGFAKYLNFAQLQARKTGESVDDLVSSIVIGLGRQTPKSFARMGIASKELKDEMAKTGDFTLALSNIIDKRLLASSDNYISELERDKQRTVEVENAKLKLGESLMVLKEYYEELSTSIQLNSISTIGWLTKHLKGIQMLLVVAASYVITTKLATLWQTKFNTQISISSILTKAHVLWTNTLKGATLLGAAATALFSGNITRAGAAMKLFQRTTKINPFALLVTGIIAAGTALAIFSKHADEAERRSKKMAEINTESDSQVNDEINRLKSLKAILLDSSAGYNVRKQALDEIKKIVPGYHASLTTEGQLIKNNASALDNYAEKLKLTAQMQVTASKLTEAQNDQSKYINDLTPREQSAVINVDQQLRDASLDQTGKNSLTLEQASFNAGITSVAYSAIKGKINQYNKDITLLQGILDETQKKLLKVDTKTSDDGGGGLNPDKSDPNAVALKNLETEHESELNKIRLSGREKGLIETDINTEILKSDTKYYTDRIKMLEGFSASAKKTAKKAEYENQIVDNKTKLLDVEDSVDKTMIDAIKKNHDDTLQIEENTSKINLSTFSKALSDKTITQDQYDMLLQSNDVATSNNRLQIEKTYLADVNALELKNGNLKAEAVKAANEAVVNADATAATARANQQKTLDNLTKDFKSQFKLTTVDEDLKIQMKVLDAAYQARKEMAVKDHLDTAELDAAYARAKEQLVQDSESKINQIRNQYGLLNQQQQFDLELVQLKHNLDAKLLTQEEYETAVKTLKRDSYKKQFDYYNQLFSGAITALQQSEMDQIDAKYDVEIEAAQGNAEEVEKLENEKEQKKLDVQKKYADAQFAVKASQIIADTAVAIMKAYADLGPIAGTISAVLLGVTGAAQLASALAERNKIKNMTVNSTSSSTSSTGTMTASGLEGGGSIDVTRSQDGRRYPNTIYDPDLRGYVDRPTVIVGDGPKGRSREWIASNAAVENPTIAPILSILDKSQQAGTIRTLDLGQAIRANMAGFASGGFITSPASRSESKSSSSPKGGDINATLSALDRTIKNLQEYGITADVSLSDFERKQNLRNKSRKIGTK